MAKRNGSKHLPAKSAGTAVVPRGRGGVRPGAGRPTHTFRDRARMHIEKAKGLEVMSKILSGDILELIGVKDGEPIVGFTANRDRITAFRELRDAAGYGSPKPVSIDVQGDVIVQVVYDP